MKLALNDLLGICRGAFPELDGLMIDIYYKTLRAGILGQTRLKKVRLGSTGIKYVTVIEVSRSLSGETQKCVYVITHELVHVLRAHPFGRRSSQHEVDFEKEVQERLNRVLVSGDRRDLLA